MPPVIVRRVVLAPAVIGLTVLAFTTLPLLLLVAAALSTVLPGRWRPLRLTWMVLLYMALESVALVAMFVLWVASGFGWRIGSPRFQRAHYAVVRWYLQILYWECCRVLHVRIAVEGPPPTSYDGRPLLILSRHAGPGDSFLVVHALINWYGREPRIVLKDTLQWDPAIDVVLNRLPNRFIRPEPGRSGALVEAQVGELSRNLDDDDAFVIFPEGGNFTEHRRKRAIARLRRKGHLDEAAKAAQMRNVLAPKPGGVLAALTAAQNADVVLVAHTGVEHMTTVLDVWRELPMDREIEMRWWIVPAAEVPEGRDARIDWLYAWWATIDDWVTERRARSNA
ncbi:MAG TPA: 1-acyl-sn-glycerol-3-phosphate acyltransferase [Candidatus Eisenbacteria bacterium]|nr:1-acyl-sn-glycerol-3-phosphate acyltransferase [Candidatus Eisenbacteria bacterium]